MAENLQLLKGRIRTANNIAQIAKTLEMVSAIKIRRAQAAMSAVQSYAERMRHLAVELIGRAAASKPVSHPYVAGSASAARLLLAIGPDKGLCGPLVANLSRELFALDREEVLLITVGKRMERAAARMARARLIAAFPLGTGIPRYSLVYELARIANEYILSSQASSLSVVFSRFVSRYSQVPVEVRILPLSGPHAASREPSYTVEPDIRTVLDTLFPQYLEVMLYWLLVEAYTSEQAARLAAMGNARHNAQDTADSLGLSYNKSRQERITNEILDLANQGIAR